ncbi:MAG: hypothetical protein H6650_01105 [Ardenticatenales bacterium]|nr:hypothetical protein [Ardenticatenales bacterium]
MSEQPGLAGDTAAAGGATKGRVHHWLLWGGLPFLVALLLYAPTLRLPLIYDTLLHIRISKGLTLASVWLPTEAFGFYRPLTFFPLLLIKRVFGHYPAWLLHGLNVFQHALNGLLLAWLSWRLWRKTLWAGLSGLLLVLFPFSYQAVAVYGHNVHPTTAGLILLGLHAYLRFLPASSRRRIFWAGLTGLFFLLALLSHESGILFGPLAALLAWQEGTGGRRRWLRLPASAWGLTAAGAIYALGYQLLPITRAPQAAEGMAGGLGLKLLYLLQAFAYPFTWFAHVWPTLPATSLILAGAGLTLLLALWAARTPRYRWPLLLGGGWWLLASLVVALPLPSDYLLNGPRLLYLSSVGLALLWPVLLQPMGDWPARRSWGRLAWGTMVLFILVSGGAFVRGRLVAYANLTSPLAVARAALAEGGPTEGVLWVNLPAWIAPTHNVYPLGAEFVSMLGPYLFVEEWTEENGLGQRPEWAVEVPDLLTSPGYGYGVQAQSSLAEVAGHWGQGTLVLISRYDAAGVRTEAAGRIVPRQAGAPVAYLGPYVLMAAAAQTCAGEVRAMLRWQTGEGGGMPASTSLFVQALDAAGRLVAQADGPPLGLRPDLLPLGRAWQAQEVRRMAAADATDLLVGVYDFASGQRYPGTTPDGASLPDNALRLPIRPCAGGE